MKTLMLSYLTIISMIYFVLLLKGGMKLKFVKKLKKGKRR